MFDNISSRFTDLWRKMSGSDTISEENVKDAVRAIRTALLEADV
ncbi:MAG: signal recognition particle receptor subunit alpha, partial [Planctomycetes bacterium]|nr:signal recognition particle receptor subunit alpha [Planctomycetota bacterium]